MYEFVVDLLGVNTVRLSRESDQTIVININLQGVEGSDKHINS